MNVHLLCIYYIFTLYLVYKLTFFFTYVLFVISQTCYLSSTQLQLTWLVYIMDILIWHGGRCFFLFGEEFFLHVVHILFFVVHILLYIPQIFCNIMYFVSIAYYITCTFACEFFLLIFYL